MTRVSSPPRERVPAVRGARHWSLVASGEGQPIGTAQLPDRTPLIVAPALSGPPSLLTPRPGDYRLYVENSDGANQQMFPIADAASALLRARALMAAGFVVRIVDGAGAPITLDTNPRYVRVGRTTLAAAPLAGQAGDSRIAQRERDRAGRSAGDEGEAAPDKRRQHTYRLMQGQAGETSRNTAREEDGIVMESATASQSGQKICLFVEPDGVTCASAATTRGYCDKHYQRVRDQAMREGTWQLSRSKKAAAAPPARKRAAPRDTPESAPLAVPLAASLAAELPSLPAEADMIGLPTSAEHPTPSPASPPHEPQAVPAREAPIMSWRIVPGETVRESTVEFTTRVPLSRAIVLEQQAMEQGLDLGTWVGDRLTNLLDVFSEEDARSPAGPPTQRMTS